MKIHQDKDYFNQDTSRSQKLAEPLKGLSSPLQVRARKRRARRVLQQHYENLLAGGRLILLTDTSESTTLKR